VATRRPATVRARTSSTFRSGKNQLTTAITVSNRINEIVFRPIAGRPKTEPSFFKRRLPRKFGTFNMDSELITKGVGNTAYYRLARSCSYLYNLVSSHRYRVTFAALQLYPTWYGPNLAPCHLRAVS